MATMGDRETKSIVARSAVEHAQFWSRVERRFASIDTTRTARESLS